MTSVFARDLAELFCRPFLGAWLVFGSLGLVFLAAEGVGQPRQIPTIFADLEDSSNGELLNKLALLEEFSSLRILPVEWHGKNAAVTMTQHRARMAIAWGRGLRVYFRPNGPAERERMLALMYQLAASVYFRKPWEHLALYAIVLGLVPENTDVPSFSFQDLGSSYVEAKGVPLAGVIALLTMFLPFLLSSSLMAREWENGTLEVLLVSPFLTWWNIIWGKILLALFLTTIIFLLGMIFCFGLFGIPARFDVSAILLVQVLGMGTSAFLGVIGSNIVKSQIGAYFLSVIYVSCLVFLTGIVFPVSETAMAAKFLGQLLPLTFSLSPLSEWLIHGSSVQLSSGDVSWLFGLFGVSCATMLTCGGVVRRRM